MSLTILVNGKVLTPQEAARNQLPMDTLLICPACNGHEVAAKMALTSSRLDGEDKRLVPRQQDRQCLTCGHRWVVVLPPEAFSKLPNP